MRAEFRRWLAESHNRAALSEDRIGWSSSQVWANFDMFHSVSSATIGNDPDLWMKNVDGTTIGYTDDNKFYFGSRYLY